MKTKTIRAELIIEFETGSGKVLLFAMITALGLLLAGCSGGREAARADTAAGKEKVEALKYLTAEGTGETEGEARNRALSELSRIFESRVFSDTYDRVTSVTGPGPGDVEQDTQSVEQKIRVVSEVSLTGVEITSTWQDKEGLYHAVASLDRYRARDNWVSELNYIDGMIEGRLKAVESLSGRLLRYRALSGAMGLWIKREVLVSRLRVLGFREGGMPGFDMRAVFHEIGSAKAGMPIYLEVEGEHGRQVRDLLAVALGQAGFFVTRERPEAAVIVSGSVEIKPVEIETPDLKYARAVVSLSVVDAEAGFSVGEVNENMRAAHPSYSEAVERALRQAIEKASGKLMLELESGEGGGMEVPPDQAVFKAARVSAA